MPDMGQLSEAVLKHLKHVFTSSRKPRATDEIAAQHYHTIAEIAEQAGQLDAFRELIQLYMDEAILVPLPGASTPLAKNFEQWLSFLVETPPWLTPADQARNRGAFLDISDAIAIVLGGRQTLTLSHQHDNCPGWLARLVMQWQSESAAVITFNYDQLVELAWLVHGNPPTGAMSWDAYPAPLTPLNARSGAVFPVKSEPGGFRLYKLHGSLGWWYSGPDSPPGDIVYDQGMRGGTWDFEGASAVQDVSLTEDRQPMIVPPATVKSPYYNNGLLRMLWKQAALALRNAEELVIMGFSLPATDMLVGSMLCTNVPHKAIITPVNRSAAIAERVCATFDLHGSSPRLNKEYTDNHDAISRWVDDNC